MRARGLETTSGRPRRTSPCSFRRTEWRRYVSRSYAEYTHRTSGPSILHPGAFRYRSSQRSRLVDGYPYAPVEMLGNATEARECCAASSRLDR